MRLEPAAGTPAPRREAHAGRALSRDHRNATGGSSCGIIPAVDAHDSPERQRSLGNTVSGRLVGLQGRLAGPFWGVMGAWAVLCGALASNHLRWDGERLLVLALVAILSNLSWGTLWDLVTGVDWYRPLADGWSSRYSEGWRLTPGVAMALPYTQPRSPGGSFSRWLGRVHGGRIGDL